jgi:hypothetical protein
MESGVFCREAQELLNSIISESLRPLKFSDLLNALTAISLIEDGNERDLIAEKILEEMRSETRIHQFEEIHEKRVPLSIMQLLVSMGLRDNVLIELCLNRLYKHIPQMQAGDIIGILKGLMKWKISHDLFMEGLVKFIFVIPSTEAEFGELVSGIIFFNSGSDHDRWLLTRLLRFRSVEIHQ